MTRATDLEAASERVRKDAQKVDGRVGERGGADAVDAVELLRVCARMHDVTAVTVTAGAIRGVCVHVADFAEHGESMDDRR